MPGFLFLPFGKTLGLRDWVCPHLALEGSLSSLDLSSQGALEMKSNSRCWGTEETEPPQQGLGEGGAPSVEGAGRDLGRDHGLVTGVRGSHRPGWG